jgi:hypothetical protein
MIIFWNINILSATILACVHQSAGESREFLLARVGFFDTWPL